MVPIPPHTAHTLSRALQFFKKPMEAPLWCCHMLGLALRSTPSWGKGLILRGPLFR